MSFLLKIQHVQLLWNKTLYNLKWFCIWIVYSTSVIIIFESSSQEKTVKIIAFSHKVFH